MALVKLLEGRHVALRRLLRQSVIRFLRRLGFGCGHVFVWGKLRRLPPLTLVRLGRSHASAFSRERQPFPADFPTGLMRGNVVALNAGVMRRFKRVVALPNPKDLKFPQPQQHFP